MANRRWTVAGTVRLAERLEALDLRPRASWVRVEGLRIPDHALDRQLRLVEVCEESERTATITARHDRESWGPFEA